MSHPSAAQTSPHAAIRSIDNRCMPMLVGESALGDGLPPGLSPAVGEGGSPFEPGREGLGRMAARTPLATG